MALLGRKRSLLCCIPCILILKLSVLPFQTNPGCSKDDKVFFRPVHVLGLPLNRGFYFFKRRCGELWQYHGHGFFWFHSYQVPKNQGRQVWDKLHREDGCFYFPRVRSREVSPCWAILPFRRSWWPNNPTLFFANCPSIVEKIKLIIDKKKNKLNNKETQNGLLEVVLPEA